MKVKNSLDKDLTIAFGSNVESVIAGTLKAGATDDLPIKETDFLNIISVENK